MIIEILAALGLGCWVLYYAPIYDSYLEKQMEDFEQYVKEEKMDRREKHLLVSIY